VLWLAVSMDGVVVALARRNCFFNRLKDSEMIASALLINLETSYPHLAGFRRRLPLATGNRVAFQRQRNSGCIQASRYPLIRRPVAVPMLSNGIDGVGIAVASGNLVELLLDIDDGKTRTRMCQCRDYHYNNLICIVGTLLWHAPFP
jgi:hypothetical protein